MKSTTKIIIPTILVSSAVFILFNYQGKLFTNSQSQSSNQNYHQTDDDIDNSTIKKLSILTNRCRGCGKCVKIDPFHFEIINRQATVVSSTNLDSSALKLAINNCLDQAIILE